MNFIFQLLFARGALVELLISSNIARYAEFRSVTRVLTWIEDKLEFVPCSRADVFKTKDVSIVEKRLLMKLLTICVEYKEENNEFAGESKATLAPTIHRPNLDPSPPSFSELCTWSAEYHFSADISVYNLIKKLRQTPEVI